MCPCHHAPSHTAPSHASHRPTPRFAAPMAITRPRRIRAARRGSETHFHPVP